MPQFTDLENKANGVEALGPKMRAVPSTEAKGFPASEEFNGYEFDSFDNQPVKQKGA